MGDNNRTVSSAHCSTVTTVRHKRSGEDQGFTLMELLIVIVVLGVIAGIVVFSLTGVSAQAAVAACKSDASTVQTAVVAYEADPKHDGSAPTGISQLTPDYLHSTPSSPDYTISLDNGTVMVTAPTSATPVAYDTTPNPCNNAGTSGGVQQAAGVTSTTAPAPNAGGGVTTTTTTTAPAPTTTTSTTRPATTTTSTTTTTTAPAANGVTVVATSSNGTYFGQDTLTVKNTSKITALSVTINVAQTTGVTYNGEFTTYPGNIGTSAHSNGGGKLTYTYVLNSGQSITSGYNGQVAAQFNGTGSVRVTSGDTWSVTSTTASGTKTSTGTF